MGRRSLLQVGQDRHLDIALMLGAIEEAVTVTDVGRPVTTAIDGVLSAAQIETLPLNGRNFLELAFLIPGNQPTPTFDPTKSNSVLVSSAGQLGRGGNVMVDGQANNDDVVGGPLLNLPIDAVQEFQIATSRFGADLGRSAASAINIVTRSGANQMAGTASLFARDGAWQARPATLDADADTPPFDRQQYSVAIGGPLRRDRIFWFGAGEFRNQDGAVLVGTRDTATRTIRRSFAQAPLDDGLWTLRVDGGSAANRLTFRYAGERGTDTSASAIERAIGSATQRQEALNRYNSVLGSWNSVRSATFVNVVNASVSTFLNQTDPVTEEPQLTFPSIQDGASFRMPQETRQTRIQVSDAASLVRGAHSLRFGGEFHQVNAAFSLGVFRQGRIELVEDFPTFDRNGDGRVDDNDLLFAVTLRSGKPDQNLELPDSNNTHVAGFVQDDWRASDRLTFSAGLRYEMDTDVNNQSRVDQLNPIVLPFVSGPRQRDLNNLGPRLGFTFAATPETTVHGGYGTYYDRIVLQVQSLERGLDGRALPVEVRAGNTFFIDPSSGRIPPFAPTLANPFSGFILPGAGASGINIIDPHLQSPTVHEFNLGVDRTAGGMRLRVDAMHGQGLRFLIGRTVGEVYNPVVGGPDRVVNIESSARTLYDALLVSAERPLRAGSSRSRGLHAGKGAELLERRSDSVPERTCRSVESGARIGADAHRPASSARCIRADDPSGTCEPVRHLDHVVGVPMDIMMPDGQSRIPVIQRNAGGRQFKTAGELNDFIRQANATGGVNGVLLPLVSDSARFNDSFNSLDMRVSRSFALGSPHANRADARSVQRLQRDEHSRDDECELLRLLQRTGPRFERSLVARLPALEQLWTAGHYRGRRLRVRWARAMQLAARVTF